MYCDRTTTPTSGVSALIASAARMPSSVWLGGIRMSTSARSGLCARTLRITSSPSPAWATTSNPWRPSSCAIPSRSSTVSSAITTRKEPFSFTNPPTSPIAWHLHPYDRALAGLRPDLERPAHGGDPVPEPAQPRAGAHRSSAAPVVADLDHHTRALLLERHQHGLGAGVLGRVRQRLGADEVDRRLHRRRQPLGVQPVEADLDRTAPRQVGQRRGEPVGGQHSRVNPA